MRRVSYVVRRIANASMGTSCVKLPNDLVCNTDV